MSVFGGWSYDEVLTPTVDFYALFERGMGDEAQRAFRFTDNDGGLLALRPDVTSSVARLAATLLRDHDRPLRLCYAAPVFRQQQASHVEWRRENTQLGCELIGASGVKADLEMLMVAVEVLTRLGLCENACITINNVEIFNGLCEQFAISSVTGETLRQLIDTRDKTELSRLLNANRVTQQATSSFLALTELTGKRETLKEAATLISNPRSSTGVSDLNSLWDVIETLNLSDLFEIDLADVSGLDYYSGLSFKVFVRGAGYRVGRGGRYDGLAANFGASEPAIGFVLSLDSLIEVVDGNFQLDTVQREDNSMTSAISINDIFAQALNKRDNGEQVRIEVSA
jgi:ATP phosphoribosyltransferase regulatory subunit